MTKTRKLRRRDLAGVGELLDAAFATHRESMSFQPAHVELFAGWTWKLPGFSLGIAEGGLIAVAMAGERRATFGGQSLRVVHVGPVGVHPSKRGLGHARRLLEEIEASARAAGIDLMTLTTEQAYGIHRLYARLGYRVVERYRPRLATLGPLVRWPADLAGTEVSAKAFWKAWKPSGGRRDAVVEVQQRPPRPAVSLRARHIRVGECAVASIDWPIRSNSTGKGRELRSCQIVATHGSGTALADAISGAGKAATQAGCSVIYHLPSLDLKHPGFRGDQGPVVLRMAHGISAAGRGAVAKARAYDEVTPAP